MRMLAAAALLAALIGPHALAQTAEEDTATEGEAGSAAGLATAAAADTFFIQKPLEYHLLATGLPGREVFLDATDTGMQLRTGEEAEAGGAADSAILKGEQPLGAITDLLIDRRGGTAGLVVELVPDMRGGGREVAVAMGLVRMLPDPEDPATTHILLSMDPIDLENAPTFERTDLPEGASEASESGSEPAEQPEGEPAEQPGSEAAEQPGIATQN